MKDEKLWIKCNECWVHMVYYAAGDWRHITISPNQSDPVEVYSHPMIAERVQAGQITVVEKPRKKEPVATDEPQVESKPRPRRKKEQGE